MPNGESFEDIRRFSVSPRLAPLRAEAFKGLEFKVSEDTGLALERELAKSRILEAAYRAVSEAPGFNPETALSVSFRLRL